MSNPLQVNVPGEGLERWAAQRQTRVRGVNPWLLTVRVGRAAIADRVFGLAAEMAFFALISLIPMFVALGAGLGFLGLVVGEEAVRDIEVFIVSAMAAVFSPELTREVLAPLVRALLTEQRTGIALSGLVVALWLASRVFTATIRALDLAYNVPEPRGLVSLRLRALGFAIAAIVVVPMTLALVVVGPLLGGGQALAARLGFGDVFALLWSVGRWPLLFGILVLYLTWLYHVGPHVDSPLRASVPGAVLGVVLWVLVSVAFRFYLETDPDQTRVTAQEEAVALVGQVVGAIVAAILWIYASSASLLIGGEFNAELVKLRAQSGDLPPPRPPGARSGV